MTMRRPILPNWVLTWLLPLVLGLAAVAVYMFLIVPPKSRPWHRDPPVPPGSAPTERAYTRYLGAIYEAQQKIKNPPPPSSTAAPKSTRVGRKPTPPSPPPPPPDTADDLADPADAAMPGVAPAEEPGAR